MVLTTRLPTANAIKGLLVGILGRDVTVEKAPLVDLRSKASRIYGVYRDVTKRATCLCILDLPLAANSGGAMLAFPLFTVNEAIRTGVLEEGLRDPVHEVLNIFSQVFNDDEHHQVFQQICLNQTELPQDAVGVLASPAGRLDVEVSIKGYGTGRMTVLVGKPSSV